MLRSLAEPIHLNHRSTRYHRCPKRRLTPSQHRRYLELELCDRSANTSGATAGHLATHPSTATQSSAAADKAADAVQQSIILGKIHYLGRRWRDVDGSGKKPMASSFEKSVKVSHQLAPLEYSESPTARH